MLFMQRMSKKRHLEVNPMHNSSLETKYVNGLIFLTEHLVIKTE